MEYRKFANTIAKAYWSDYVSYSLQPQVLH